MLNTKQIEWLKKYREDNEFLGQEDPGWQRAICVHSGNLEKIYQKLKELEIKEM